MSSELDPRRKLTLAEVTDTQQPEREYAILRTGRRFKDIASAIFKEGMFHHTVQAVLEFIDNAMNFRDSQGQTQIITSLGEEKLIVRSSREQGIDVNTIKRIFTLGDSDEVGVGTKGVGMKFAAMALAKDLLFEGKLPGSRTKWVVAARGIGDNKIDYEGTLAIDPVKAPEHEMPYGVVNIELHGMKWGTDPLSASQLRNAISEVYSPLLISDDYEFGNPHKDKSTQRFRLNEKGDWEKANDKILVLLQPHKKKIQQIKPQEVPLKPDSVISRAVIRTAKDEPIGIEGGVIDTTNPVHKGVKPGIRIFYNGRMVERAIFPENDERWRDSRVRNQLYLAVHIDHVRNIKDVLQMNKSAGIIRESEQWIRIMEVATKAAESLINNIMAQERRSKFVYSARFREAFMTGRKWTDAAIRDLEAEGDIEGIERSQEVTREIAHAQERPEKRTSDASTAREPSKSSRDKGSAEKGGTPWHEQKATTLSTANADPTLERRRRSAYYIRYSPLASGRTSEISVENGKTYLVINSEHPLNEILELFAAKDPIYADLLASSASAREQMYNVALELSKGDATKFDRIYQAGLAKIGIIVTQQPCWNILQSSLLLAK